MVELLKVDYPDYRLLLEIEEIITG